MAPRATRSGRKTKAPLRPDEAVVPITDPRRRDGRTRVVKKKKSKHYDEDSDIEILGIPGQQVSQHDRNHGMDDRTSFGNCDKAPRDENKNQQPSHLPSSIPVLPTYDIQGGIGIGTPSRQLEIGGASQHNLEMGIQVEDEESGGNVHIPSHLQASHGSTQAPTPSRATQRTGEQSRCTQQTLGIHGVTSIHQNHEGDADINMATSFAPFDDVISPDSSASEVTDVDDRLHLIFKPKIQNFVRFQSLLDSAVQVSGQFKPAEEHLKMKKWKGQDSGSSSMPVKASQKEAIQTDASDHSDVWPFTSMQEELVQLQAAPSTALQIIGNERKASVILVGILAKGKAHNGTASAILPHRSTVGQVYDAILQSSEMRVERIKRALGKSTDERIFIATSDCALEIEAQDYQSLRNGYVELGYLSDVRDKAYIAPISRKDKKKAEEAAELLESQGFSKDLPLYVIYIYVEVCPSS